MGRVAQCYWGANAEAVLMMVVVGVIGKLCEGGDSGEQFGDFGSFDRCE